MVHLNTVRQICKRSLCNYPPNTGFRSGMTAVTIFSFTIKRQWRSFPITSCCSAKTRLSSTELRLALVRTPDVMPMHITEYSLKSKHKQATTTTAWEIEAYRQVTRDAPSRSSNTMLWRHTSTIRDTSCVRAQARVSHSAIYHFLFQNLRGQRICSLKLENAPIESIGDRGIVLYYY